MEKKRLAQTIGVHILKRVGSGSTMKFDERGAGYIQLSWKDTQDTFFEREIGAYDNVK